MDRRNLVLDAGLAVLAAGIALGTLAVEGFGTPSPDGAELDVLGAVLALAATLPLTLRRVAPAWIYAVVSLATFALLALRYPLDFPLGALIAGYTVAVRHSGRPRPVRLLVLAAIVGFGPIVTLIYTVAGQDPMNIVLEMSFLTLLFVAAWVSGDRARLRHERMAELEERARRTEREIEREHRLAAAQERTRIARELHDAAGHAISVILIQAGAARLLHERDPERSKRALNTIEEVARGTMDEIARLVRALRDDEEPEPAPADPDAIDALVQRYRADGLTVVTQVDGARRRLPHGVAWAAYRIVQEALTNATRHGDGTATVAVRFAPDGVGITVTNPAPARQPAKGGGHGIVGMRERAMLLGGTLDTGLSGGTYRLAAWLPDRAAADLGVPG